MISENSKYNIQKLMELHSEAMFTYDSNKRLLHINEPWPGSGPAPLMFMGRTIEGKTICRFRADIPEPFVDQLIELSEKDPVLADLQERPVYSNDYRRVLQGQRITMGPCFIFPDKAEGSREVVHVNRNNMELLQGGFEWLLSEIDYAQPCVAVICDEKAVSVCRSVRITQEAHEAGLEAAAGLGCSSTQRRSRAALQQLLG